MVAYLLMGSQGETEEQKTILENRYSRGQIRLLVEAEQRYGFNEIVDWMKFGVDSQLQPDDLNRIRNVQMPASPPRAPAFPASYATESPPAPETLVLRGVSWINGRPFASINDRSLAVGESAKVRLGKTNLTIRCLSISTNAVRVQTVPGGTEQELKLTSRR